MGTVAAPQPAFVPVRPKQVPDGERPSSVFGLVLTYALLVPLVFLAARGAFSFQDTGFNSSAGGMTTPETGQGSALHSAEILVSYSIMLLAIVPVWRRVWAACLENALLLALPFWAVCSTLWSSDPTRTFSFGMLAMIITLFGIYLPVRFTPRQQLQIFLLLGLLMTVLSFVLVAGMPSAGIDYKNATVGVEGMYPQKNICAVTTVTFMLAAFFYRFQGLGRGLKRAGYVALLLALVVGTTARTGFILLLVLVLFVLLLKFLHRLRPIERLLVTLFTPALALLAGWAVYANIESILRFLGKDPTLSGRTTIWSVVSLSIVKRPLIGFGYSAFWTVKNPEAMHLSIAAGDPKLNNAENGVLQMCLDLGLIGVAILGVVLFRSCRNALACFRSDTPNYAMWYMSIVFITLLSLVDGNKFMLPTGIEWVMFIMADVGLANEARRVRSYRPS